MPHEFGEYSAVWSPTKPISPSIYAGFGEKFGIFSLTLRENQTPPLLRGGGGVIFHLPASKSLVAPEC
jgi:hypothetical protein